MCLLIAAPKGTFIEKLHLENGFANNNDGAGLAYVHKRKVIVEKGFFLFEDFYKRYLEVGIETPRLIHFRWSTGGMTNEENCHPFFVNTKLAFAHNGIFSCTTACKDFSDTWYFNEKLLKPMLAKSHNMIHKPHIQWLLKRAIGKSNKVAFIDNTGKIVIINEEEGHYEKGVWFSNYGYNYSRGTVYQGFGSNKLPSHYQNNNNNSSKSTDDFAQQFEEDGMIYAELSDHERYEAWVRRQYGDINERKMLTE